MRVGVSYKPMAHEKSVRNHPNGHIKLPSSSRAPYGSKTREPVGNPMTCCASLQDFSKIFRLVWAP